MKWIDIKVQMPDELREYDKFIVYYYNDELDNGVTCAEFRACGNISRKRNQVFSIPGRFGIPVTHWMELPKPPNT